MWSTSKYVAVPKVPKGIMDSKELGENFCMPFNYEHLNTHKWNMQNWETRSWKIFVYSLCIQLHYYKLVVGKGRVAKPSCLAKR